MLSLLPRLKKKAGWYVHVHTIANIFHNSSGPCGRIVYQAAFPLTSAWIQGWHCAKLDLGIECPGFIKDFGNSYYSHSNSPSVSNPSCLHTTLLSKMSHRSSQTVPKLLFLQTSTLPSTKLYSSWQLLISTRLTSYLHSVIVWPADPKTMYSVAVLFSPARLLTSLTSPSLHAIYKRCKDMGYIVLEFIVLVVTYHMTNHHQSNQGSRHRWNFLQYLYTWHFYHKSDYQESTHQCL